jgi:hypothetical protein
LHRHISFPRDYCAATGYTAARAAASTRHANHREVAAAAQNPEITAQKAEIQVFPARIGLR